MAATQRAADSQTSEAPELNANVQRFQALHGHRNPVGLLHLMRKALVWTKLVQNAPASSPRTALGLGRTLMASCR